MTTTELVVSHRKLVLHLARKMGRGGNHTDDLVGAGNIGLIEAAEKFDPARGFQFTTYAAWWIRARMFAYLSANAHGVVRIPDSHQARIRYRLPKMQAKLEAAGLEVTDKLLASQLRCTEKNVQEATERAAYADVSIDAPVWNDQGLTRIEMIAADEDSPEESFSEVEITEQTRKKLLDSLGQLPERERFIVEQRFLEGRTLADVGGELGLSRERTRQIEAVAMRRLQGMMTKRPRLPVDQIEMRI